jgi:hypothetical protein
MSLATNSGVRVCDATLDAETFAIRTRFRLALLGQLKVLIGGLTSWRLPESELWRVGEEDHCCLECVSRVSPKESIP